MFDKSKLMRDRDGHLKRKYKYTYKTVLWKRGLFGIPYRKTEYKTIWLDWKEYKKLKYRPYTIEEMMFYDDLFGDD